MRHEALAIDGGTPSRQKPFTTFQSMDAAEEAAVVRVVRSGVLSAYLGTWSEGFMGGTEVKALEKEWAEFFNTPHAVAMNSATSGLFAAMGALGIGPGDEVIVPAWTMCATATAPLIYQAMPVFADIDPKTFTLDPASVERAITSKTKAIITVNLFGHPSRLDDLMVLARKYGLKVVEDNAQSPGAIDGGRYTGTIADIGVFSLNYHKHIHSGEGGICVTSDARLAERLQLIRNHAEAVVEAKGVEDMTNMVGWNYRMTELEAAVARCQLKKLPDIIDKKNSQAEQLNYYLQDMEGLQTPYVRQGCRHVYYTYPLRLQEEGLGFSRDEFVAALQAEGIPIVRTYVKPLYLIPLFQKKTGFGSRQFPFQLPENKDRSYPQGLCPVTEKLYDKELCYLPWCLYDFSDQDVKDIAFAIHKVFRLLREKSLTTHLTGGVLHAPF